MSRQRATAALSAGARWRWWEAALWAAATAAWALLPSYHLLINEIAILALFALSLDLVLGYAGIVSLGHAAYFGLGAYLAGLLTKWGVTDPLLGLAIVAPASAALGLATSFLVLRGSDLTRIMVTLSVSLVLFEAANRLTWLTGGADGLQGVAPGPLLGVWEFDIFGRIGSAYSLLVLFVLFLIARRIVHSPFGLTVRAVQANPLRAAAIGLPVNLRIVAFYSLGATYAGLAGALLVQTTQFASLDVLAFHRSAEVMLMLVIGGVGYLYGGLLGAVGFKVLQDLLSVQTPQYWQFWVGIVLIALVVIGRERIAASLRPAWARRLFARR